LTIFPIDFLKEVIFGVKLLSAASKQAIYEVDPSALSKVMPVQVGMEIRV